MNNLEHFLTFDLCYTIRRMLRVVFFIPSYFDSNSFLRLRLEILSRWDLVILPEFILLDDTCGEDLGLFQVDYLPNTRRCSFKHHLGHQKILVEGIRSFCNDPLESELGCQVLMITMDGDGEDRSEDALRLIHEWIDQKDKDPLVVAKRSDREPHSLYGFARERYVDFFYFLTGIKWETGNFATFSLVSAQKFIFHEDFNWSYASSLIKHAPIIVLLACERGKRWEGKTRMGLIGWLYHGYILLRPHRARIYDRFSLNR